LFIAIFVGWCMRESSVRDEMAISNSTFYDLWRVLLRYIAPVAVSLIFLRVIGVI